MAATAPATAKSTLPVLRTISPAALVWEAEAAEPVEEPVADASESASVVVAASLLLAAVVLEPLDEPVWVALALAEEPYSDAFWQ